MKIKTLLFVGAITFALATPESLMANPRPKPKPGKPDIEDAKKGGKKHPKLDVAKIKERLKVAFEKRKKNRGDAKKEGNKVRNKGGRAFGKLVRDDDKIKELRDAFKAAAKEQHGKVKDLHKQLKDASDEDKDSLRELLKGLRADWVEGMKGNREEVRARLKEIREEFKNKRDEVIDANDDDGDDDPGE
ncbi:MAG: seryl-tRNA synthetase [Limisphaerales bacterium]|jgi:seryl-tRNA synthetase